METLYENWPHGTSTSGTVLNWIHEVGLYNAKTVAYYILLLVLLILMLDLWFYFRKFCH
jgi:hypothetical protein